MNETKQIEKPSEKNFTLEKVKLANCGGLEAIYEVVEIRGSESYVNSYSVKNAADVHPDLLGLFKQLRPIVARVFGMTSFLSFTENPDNKIKQDVQDKAREFADELLERIEVRGVSYSGKDDNVGVIITSVLEVSNELKTCINTPRMKMATVSFGFEEELENIVGEIEREVYKFLFEGKRAQLSLFGQDGSATAEYLEEEQILAEGEEQE